MTPERLKEIQKKTVEAEKLLSIVDHLRSGIANLKSISTDSSSDAFVILKFSSSPRLSIEYKGGKGVAVSGGEHVRSQSLVDALVFVLRQELTVREALFESLTIEERLDAATQSSQKQAFENHAFPAMVLVPEGSRPSECPPEPGVISSECPPLDAKEVENSSL